MFEATDARIAHPTETPEVSRYATFAGSGAPGGVAGLVTAVAAVAVTVTALTSTPTAFASPTVSDLVNQIDEANYTRLLDERLYTRSGDDRGYGPEHDLARDNIVEEFNALGLDVSLHGFPYRGETYYNVQAVQDGYGRTNEVFIIGAHYDSVNNPGADDNASGVAGVIEIARVLSQYTFEASIVYIAFDREEQGLYGSSAWVNDYRETDIRGMISLDMIAYDPFDRDRALLYGSSASNPLKDDLADAMLTYGGIAAFDDGRGDFSDHAPFERRGFQACLLIEYDVWSNPHYHLQSDTIDTPNYINYG
ncbi:MAG: M28 family metallopeptidase, partial [Planctomycetota bacterium]